MKRFFMFAMLAFATLAMTTTLTSCGSDDDDEISPKGKTTTYTVLAVSVPNDVYNNFDLAFTLNGKPIELTRKTTSSTRTVSLRYEEAASHKGDSVNCEVTLKPNVDYDSIDQFIYGSGHTYTTAEMYSDGSFGEVSFDVLVSSLTVELSTIIEKGYATDNKSALEYIGERVQKGLKGVVK